MQLSTVNQRIADELAAEMRLEHRRALLFVKLRSFLAVDLRSAPADEHRTVPVDGRLRRVVWAPWGTLPAGTRRLTYREFKLAYYGGKACQSESLAAVFKFVNLRRDQSSAIH